MDFLSVCFFCESKYRYKDTCLILEANHEVTDKYVKDQMKKWKPEREICEVTDKNVRDNS